MPTWPTQLPGFNSGLRETQMDGFVRTPTDIGPGQQRRRYSATPVYFAGEMTFTQAERLTFQTFYNTELANGANTFTMDDPVTGNSATFQFTRAPNFRIVSGADGNVHIASISLERLP